MDKKEQLACGHVQQKAKSRLEAEALVGAVNHPAVLPGLRMNEVPMSLRYQFVTDHRATLAQHLQ